MGSPRSQTSKCKIWGLPVESVEFQEKLGVSSILTETSKKQGKCRMGFPELYPMYS